MTFRFWRNRHGGIRIGALILLSVLSADAVHGMLRGGWDVVQLLLPLLLLAGLIATAGPTDRRWPVRRIAGTLAFLAVAGLFTRDVIQGWNCSMHH